MAETAATSLVAIKYRAFLSYSHADTAWAKWLHAALENFRIDKDLAGRTTALGPVPQTLRPIFRDREDFSGGHTLTGATIAALDASSALIVLCSTIAATRPAVNEEVRLFRSRHPDRPVIPVIVEGAYPDNFPPALRYALAPDGAVTKEPVTILGPDLRESGDGKTLGLAKAVAGLIGVPSDDIFRRAERARRRQARLRNGIVGVIVMLMASGGFFAWQSHQTQLTLADRQSTLDEIQALVARYSPVGSAQAATPGAGLTAAITAIANGAATDARYAKALELLKAGRPAEAEPLLKAVADEMATRAKSDAKQAAEAYRNLGAIAGLGDPKRAREYYARALEFDADNADALYWAGWFELQAGYLDGSERHYRRLIALKADAPDSSEVYWARLGLGDIRIGRGDLAAARSDFVQAQAIAERLAKADPSNIAWQRNLFASHERVGNVLAAQGNFGEALTSYRQGLAIGEQVLKDDPNNTDWQRNLSVSYEKIGEVLLAQAKLPESLTSFRDSLAIRERLAKAEPNNAGYQRDLSVSNNKVGEVLVAQGNHAEAQTSFREAITIASRLADADPSNAGWQRDLSVYHEKIGEVLVAQNNDAEALTSFRDSLAIRQRLTKIDPNNTGWQRDLSVSYEKVGDVLATQNNLAEAVTSFRDSLAIRERLARADLNNAQWQLDVVASHWRLAQRGDEPARRWAFIVAEMRKLKNENRLRPDWEQFLPAAEQELAKFSGAQGGRR